MWQITLFQKVPVVLLSLPIETQTGWIIRKEPMHDRWLRQEIEIQRTL